MKLITTTALALVAALTAAPAVAQTKPAPAQQQQEPKATPSKGALKALSELNDAVQKNDVANIPAKLAAAQAVATTKDDKYLIGRLQLQAAIAAKNNAAMAAAVDAIAASNFLDAAAVSKFYSGLGGSLYNEKEYARAAAAYQRALALNPNNSDAANMLGDALLAGGQKAEAVAAYQRLLQADAAAGRKPDEALIKRALAVAYDAKSPAAIDLARQWVTNYPSAASWSDTVAIYTNLNQPDVEGRLDLYRLMQATGALKTGGEYAQYARLAADQNNFNEAQAAFDAGVAAKLIDPAKAEYSDLAQGLKTKGKASTADLEAAAKSAQTGIALVHIGDRYAAMGNNAKAVELYRAALSKPGTDAGVANLHMGIALARSGDKAGAIAALNAVTGPRADIAKLWLTYVNQKA
jgi:tetratricopeptide (TPR) repeat protein